MVFRFDTFADYPIVHAMSQRRLNAPSQGDVGYARDTITADIKLNRAAFLASAQVASEALTLGRQVHGDHVEVVTGKDRGRGQPPTFDALPNTDGLLTVDARLAIGVIIADCVPILLYDPAHHALGVVHAGWRGSVMRIAESAVETMAHAFSSRPSDLRAGIGPSIGPCCYEVGDEVVDAWEASGGREASQAIVSKSPRSHFDLWRANRLVLEQAGIPPDQIETAAVCTRCAAEQYFSHRAAMAGERPRGRMIMVAQLS